MGTGMCKEVPPVAGRDGGGGAWANGGCRETVDRALERILRRKSQVIRGSGIHAGTSALKNGSHLRSPTSQKTFLAMDQVTRPPSALKGPRSPPLGDAPFTEVPLPTPPLQREDAQVSDIPPVRPPRRKDRMKKPKLPFPRRNQSALSLPAQGGVPEEAAARLESYIKRCHSYGTVPVLIEELMESGHVSSLSSLSSSTLDSSAARDRPGDRLPSFASVTPPPSPSSTPPEGNEDHSPRLPRFFIGTRGRSASSSSAHDPPSPMSPSVVSFWDHGDERKVLSPPPPHYASSDASRRRATPVTDRREVRLDHRALRRVKSQENSESQPRHQKNTEYVSPLSENVIDMLPTCTSGPPTMTFGRARSSPHIATGPKTPRVGFEIDRNNPRTILLRILGEYQCLPGSGALARGGRKGEEEELAALEKQLDGKRAFAGKKGGKGGKEEEEQKGGRGKREGGGGEGEGDDDDDGEDDSSSVTPSLGELEEALAQMLDEDDWEEKEEERVGMAVEERMREAVEVRNKTEGNMDAAASSMSLRLKRENTFTALSALSRGE